jgi:hypothetical protein
MATSTNVVFLGCNYGNKKVKRHFDALKAQWEEDYPIRVVLIDKEKAKGSRDLWDEIREAIEVSALAIFDVSAFRPNVVLELGYALATKDPETVLVSFDARKARAGKKPDWLLSDIGHLNRYPYTSLPQLDDKLEENVAKVPAVSRFAEFAAATERETNASGKYTTAGLAVLHALRQRGDLSEDQLDAIPKGSGIRVATLRALLKKYKLARRSQGPHGRWSLV